MNTKQILGMNVAINESNYDPANVESAIDEIISGIHKLEHLRGLLDASFYAEDNPKKNTKQIFQKAEDTLQLALVLYKKLKKAL